ncbi:MAG: adenosylcobinamide-GDP ribazoletransferase [Synechococcus sp.]
MPWLQDLAGAWMFYTVLPSWPGLTPRFERIARFAPWLGALIGAIQLLCWWLFHQLGWSAWSCSAVVVALGIWLSGGLHHDGLMDTADGLGAGEERRLAAMDDSRVGASGVLALLMVVLVELAAMSELALHHPLALVLAPFWARVAPLWAMARFPYLRAQGTAGFHRRHGQPGWDAIPTLVCLPVLLALTGWEWLLVGGLAALLPAEWCGRRLGGHTGDSYGACVVLGQALSLVLMALVARLS